MNTTVEHRCADGKDAALPLPSFVGAFAILERKGKLHVFAALVLDGDISIEESLRNARRDMPGLQWRLFEPNNRPRKGAPANTARYSSYSVEYRDGRVIVDFETLGDFAAAFTNGTEGTVLGTPMTVEEAVATARGLLNG